MMDAVFSRLYYAPRWYAEFAVYPPLRFMSFGVAIQAEDHVQYVKIGVLFFSLIIGRR